MTKLIAPLFFAALALSLHPAPAAAQGRAVSCGCYCGVVLSPPCSDDACKSACGYGGGSNAAYGGEPPMAGVKVGTWTRHFGRKHNERMSDCGSNPLCMLMGTAVTVITMPIGLVVDAPVLIVKGVVYGAVGIGRGVKAVGRGIGGLFASKPKPVVTVYAPEPAPPAAAAPADCAAVKAKQDALLAEERVDAEAFDAAIVKSQLDQGVAKAKDAAVEAVPHADESLKAKDLATTLRDFHQDTRKCRATGGTSETFLACMDAVNKLYLELLGRLVDTAKVDAAKDALQKYTAKITEKSLPLAADAARCAGTP